MSRRHRAIVFMGGVLALAGCSLLVDLDDGYVAGSRADAGGEAGANARDSGKATDAEGGDGDGEAADAGPLLSEDFDDPTLASWLLVGSPIPRVAGSVFGHATVFDNAGDPNYPSGAISKRPVSCPTGGCTIAVDVYIDFSDLGGCWATATIAVMPSLVAPTDVVDDMHIPDAAEGALLGMSIDAEGDLCAAYPPATRRHAWFAVSYRASDGSQNGPELRTISADAFVNKWTHLEMRVAGASAPPTFMADGKLIYAGEKAPDPALFGPRNIYLGSRSSGSAGKAYHDALRVFGP